MEETNPVVEEEETLEKETEEPLEDVELEDVEAEEIVEDVGEVVD